MVTKANPLGFPVSRSKGILTSTTGPWAANIVSSSFSVVLKMRFPTYNFELFMMIFYRLFCFGPFPVIGSQKSSMSNQMKIFPCLGILDRISIQLNVPQGAANANFIKVYRWVRREPRTPVGGTASHGGVLK
jgi:hypothetical protein